MTGSSGTKPYLEAPIDPSRMETLGEWAAYLGRTFGTGGALCALRYYERLSWIGPGARRETERQLRGVSLDETNTAPDGDPGRPIGPLAALSETPFGAHARSLEFVAALSVDDLEEETLRATLAKRRGGVERSPSEGPPEGRAAAASTD
jgi:hypothetical protein